jgi:Fe-S cluster biogenesis protein NfuA/nitrite reductase/ring-hydroxylating ferredoxin subunit
MDAATATPTAPTPEQLLDQVQELQERLDNRGERSTVELADALVATIVQMYGAGLERIFSRLGSITKAGPELARELAEDPFLSTLLLIHDLHPVGLEQRVQGALDSVRPYMESHGGSVELLSVTGGVARIHLRGSCSDCAASAVTLELAIKQALEQAAPDLEGLEVEGMQAGGLQDGLPTVTGTSGSELPMVQVSAAASNGTALPMADAPTPGWFDAGTLPVTDDDALGVVNVAGHALVIAQVDGTLLAYRDVCAACREPLGDGELRAGTLTCRACNRSFFLPRAGRSLDDDGLQLEPVPLLRDGDSVRVALAT